ncbi:trichohyalin-like isoform X1 [Rhopilema esculentum]|uniref:trichohyalin-like isoform X1 n=2 Tax=Rhopilema esculentum TaxID=499914 RepID=UPI0031E08760
MCVSDIIGLMFASDIDDFLWLLKTGTRRRRKMADTEQMAENQSISTDDGSKDSKDDDSFGIAAGKIPDNAFFSSSALNQSCGANQARLHKQPQKEKYGAWTPVYNDKNQFLDIDLGETVQVGAIATQGRPAYTEDGGWYVESYSLAYGNDGDSFQNLREYGISKVFEGNTDSETVVKNQLKNAISCRYIRIKPVTWHNHIALRVEVYKPSATTQSSKKRSTPQRQTSKGSSSRGVPRTANRDNASKPVLESITLDAKQGLPRRPNEAEQISVADSVPRPDSKEVLVLNDKRPDPEIHVKVSENGLKDQNTGDDNKSSFEIIEPEDLQMKSGLLLSEKSSTEGDDSMEDEGSFEKINQPEMIPIVSVRNQANVFENRPEVEKTAPAFRAMTKGGSAVSTRDGSKFIGKIKLVKREEPEEDSNQDDKPVEKKEPEYVLPDAVKERLVNYQEVVLRKNGSREDLSKRKSLVLEADLKYREEMESSVLDRLKVFKDTESKCKEDLELSKQEEEKRLSLKREAEKRRSLALQKEKERMLAILEKQKEEEEEQRRKQEEAKADEFVEINAGVLSFEPVVNDRLKLFKESERQEKEKQEALKEEAEKKRIAKETAERKRELAIQREKERLQELMNKKQEELRLMNADQSSESNSANGEYEEEPPVPAIVHDRIKMFKDSERASKERQNALLLEAKNKRAAEEEAERSRILVEQQPKKINEEVEKEAETDKKGIFGEERQNEEEVVVAVEDLNVESGISFDFMEENGGDELDRKNQEDHVDQVVIKDKNDNNNDEMDFQKRLESIDTHHDGYDPDHERRMLEEAEAAFKSFATHQKGGTKPKRSAKTESLIKSFTTPGDVQPACKTPTSLNDVAERKEKKQSLEEHVISEKQTDIHVIPVDKAKAVDATRPSDASSEKNVCLSGLVKERAGIFSKNMPPVAVHKTETPHANVKKWIASQNQNCAENGDEERSLLNSQLEELERKSARTNEMIEKCRQQGDDEGALEFEEELHCTLLEISKTKRKLLKVEKEHGGTRQLVHSFSVSSESRSIPDDNLSDKASAASRSQKGSSSTKLSKECKAPVDKEPPPVDASSFNDGGEIVVEGNVFSQIKTYEEESTRQRKKMAEIRKSLSLSRSSLDIYENPPPMGFGGPEFAKDKSKSSRECKLPRDNPAPAVEYEKFNDDGDCVPEGNVHNRMQLFSSK